jgi:hypothetical protein
VTGGWGTGKRKRKRPPSNDPGRPPKGLASGSLANPRRTVIHIIVSDATAEDLADAPDTDD